MLIPKEAAGVKVAFLPPMSGLAAVEPKWEPGRINVLLGEGQTPKFYVICAIKSLKSLSRRMSGMN
jgi:hypothetical protein